MIRNINFYNVVVIQESLFVSHLEGTKAQAYGKRLRSANKNICNTCKYKLYDYLKLFLPFF